MVQEVAVAAVQLPDHPTNVDPVAGVSVRVTGDPTAKLWLQTVPPLPQSINGAVPLVVITVPVPVPRKPIDSTGAGVVGVEEYWEVIVTSIVDVITEPLPLLVVVGAIAVTVVPVVKPNAGSPCDVSKPVAETEAAPGELEIQDTVSVRFWTGPLPERLPIARSCAVPPGPTNDCAPGMMIRVGV
jgi:hypothetical protein